MLPRTHGSTVFTRGETQALVTATLGTAEDQQKIEMVDGEIYKRFMLHYNFPPFSVGEVAFLSGPGRREVGHGALAERALTPLVPAEETFPYTMRVVSDILESNGSSSMASVCGGSLALMDAGVPLKAAVAGVAMGLVMDEKSGRYAVLSDIAGAEDHYGDMDFKVAGTAEGITALQMDIKVTGITTDIMRKALEQARQGRLFILEKMREALSSPRGNISAYAPRIVTIKIPVDKIRDVIGPGGKMIRSIIDRTGVKIDVEDDGRVNVASVDEVSAQKAIAIIQELTATPELNKTYMGKVQRITEFGAFVEIMPGVDGLLHVSEIAHYRVKDVRDELKEGEQVMVKVINIDPSGKIRLSRKALLPEPEGQPQAQGPGSGGWPRARPARARSAIARAFRPAERAAEPARRASASKLRGAADHESQASAGVAGRAGNGGGTGVRRPAAPRDYRQSTEVFVRAFAYRGPAQRPREDNAGGDGHPSQLHRGCLSHREAREPGPRRELRVPGRSARNIPVLLQHRGRRRLPQHARRARRQIGSGLGAVRMRLLRNPYTK